MIMRMDEEIAGRIYDLLADDEPDMIDALARVPCHGRKEKAVGYISDWINCLPDKTIRNVVRTINEFEDIHGRTGRSATARTELVRYDMCRRAGSLLAEHLRYNSISPISVGLSAGGTWEDFSQMLWDRDRARAMPVIEALNRDEDFTMSGFVADEMRNALNAGGRPAAREREKIRRAPER